MELNKIFNNLDNLNVTYCTDSKGWDPKTVKLEEAAIEATNKSLLALADSLKTASNKKSIAEKKSNKESIQEYSEEIDKLREEINELKLNSISQARRLETYRNSVIHYLEQVNTLVQDNLDLQKEVTSIIETKLTETLKNRINSRDELLKRMEPYRIIQNATTNNPKVANIINKIEAYSNKIRKNEKRQSEQAILSSTQKSITKQRKLLEKQFSGTVVRKADIDKIQSLSSLNSDIAKADIKIDGYNKQINTYNQEINTIFNKSADEAKQPVVTTSLVPVTKPKWFQFIKRFKNWFQSRDNNSEQIYNQPTVESTKSLAEDEKNQFKESMKYDVNQDKLETDYLKDEEAQINTQNQPEPATISQNNQELQR